MRPRTSATARSFRALSSPARLLLLNQFGISLGFYLVLPFLATYLRDDLGFATALVGVVLGLRTLSQQGLYLLGGTAADRLGPRPVIILGCAVRVVGFGMFAATTSVAGIVLGTVLTGVAGAIFSPAVVTYLTHESPGRRAEAFATYNVVANTGTLLGPVLGAVLLAVDFRLVSLIACAVFACLTVAQLLFLPHQEATAPERGVLRNWREVVGNRRFLLFTLAGSGYFGLFNQLYLALPLEAQRVTGRSGAISAVFVVSTIVGIVFGVRLTAWCRARWSAGRSMATGLLLIGAGFAPPALLSPFTTTTAHPLPLPDALVAVAPVVLGTVVFSVGIAIANPFMIDLLPVVGSEKLVGTYYGFFYLVSALVAAGISAGVGALLEFDGAAARWTPFTALLLIGLLGGALIATMQRRRLLDPTHPHPA
ncbi:MFS transporter [Umezawaea endophytica]|uniref:MFS transporter n=1 Tax=Umezawaea endophytica TaxID=1654476 RepID=A0A9X2VFZ6_9PSEU|nr:MFS transporter [Umezawaea endophytica]MCS7475434.1 MFS transporter [Umezawaea endophytica]